MPEGCDVELPVVYLPGVIVFPGETVALRLGLAADALVHEVLSGARSTHLGIVPVLDRAPTAIGVPAFYRSRR